MAKYNTLKQGEEELEIQRLLVKLQWDEIQATILFCAESHERFETTVRDLLEAHLQVLLKKFEAVILKMQKSVGASGELRRVRYALFGKQTLEDLIADLEKWQARFLQYLQLIIFTGHRLEPKSPVEARAMQTPSLNVVAKLQNIFDPTSQLSPSTSFVEFQEHDLPPPELARSIDHSTVFIFESAATSAEVDLVIDQRSYDRDHDNVRYVRQIVRETARILSAADPHLMSILPCRGFIHRPELSRFDIVLTIPHQVQAAVPRSLRDLLTDPKYGNHTYHSLSERIQVARRLASAVFYVHTSKLVHKNIRPETILMVDVTNGHATGSKAKTTNRYPYKLGRPFLVGFDNVRQVDLEWTSKRDGTLEWEADIYHHPSRHGSTAAKYYSMQHDIYSLGVVLLELALWRPFIVFSEEQRDNLLNKVIFRDGQEIVTGLKNGDRDASRRIANYHIKLAKNEVPVALGDKFSRVVLSCLQGVDETGGTEDDHGDDDHSDTELGLKFIQTVLADLEDISI